MADVNECSVCGIAETYMRAGLKLGEAMFNATVGSIQSLLALSLALFLLYEVFKLLYPFGSERRSSEIFNSISGRIGVVMLVGFVVLSPKFYLNYIFNPILTVSANFSNILLGASEAFGSEGSKAAIAQVEKCIGEQPDGQEKIVKTVSCQMGMIQKTLQNGIDLMNAVLLTDKVGLLELPDVFKKFAGYLAVGLVIAVYGFAMMRFPMQALDLIFRFTLVSVLSPIILAASAFPKVRYIAVAGIKGLGHSALTLAFMSAIAGVIAYVMIETSADIFEGMGIKNVERTLEGIKAAANGGEATAEKISLLTAPYWQMLFLAVAANYLFKQASRFAGIFIDSNIDDVSDGMWEKTIGVTTVVVNTALNVATLGKAAIATKTISGIANALKKI